MTRLCLLLSLVALTACGSSSKKNEEPAPAPKPALTLPTTLEEAVHSGYRSPENTPRDVYRHPLETLQFFGLQPQMTVVEVAPGAGWYTEILAPYLSTNGHYIAAGPAPSPNAEAAGNASKVSSFLTAHPDVAGHVAVSTFSPPDQVDIAPPGTADMVLTFRNVHNWMGRGNADAAFKAFFKALKSGGILGVVEHRADPKKPQNPKAASGYVRESEIQRLAKKAGFKFVGKSEINANPKDTKNYPDGVWTLPPTLRDGDKDKDRYLAIGESDRLTMKFVKPDRR